MWSCSLSGAASATRIRHPLWVGRLFAVVTLVLMACPSPAFPLSELLAEDLTPDARAELVGDACARVVTPEELNSLLQSTSPRPAQIDAARIAACRKDPALIPLMYASFHRAKAAHLANDPDVYERLLRTLQGFGADTLRAYLHDPELGLGGAAHAELSQLAWGRLHHDWLAPLGGDAAPVEPPETSSAPVLAEAARWLDDVLSAPDGLVRLQTDSGDHGYVFLQRLQGWHLAALSQDPAHTRLAAEVCAQSSLCSEKRDDPTQIGLPLRPVVPVDVPPAAAESVIAPASRLSPTSMALLLLLAAWSAWVLVVRAKPGWRGALFPLGAVGLAPTLLVGAEFVLGAFGVAPMAEQGGAGWSEPQALRGTQNTPGFLLEPRTWDGEPWVEVVNDGARWTALPASSPDAWRIVTLGESSVHASNHLAEESFAEILGRRLRLSTGRPVEILNGGVGGAISDDIVSVAMDALAADPDLLVLYHGINDLGRLETLAGMRAFSPLQLGIRVLLDESRIARVLHDLLPPRLSVARPTDQGAWRDDEPVEGDVALRLAELAALRCSRNQQRIVRMAQERGVPVIVIAQALVTGSTFPEDAEKRRLLREIAEKTAARTGATLLDGHAILGAHSLAHNGTADPGPAYFWDQLHPSRLGHAVLGEAIAPTALRLLQDSR